MRKMIVSVTLAMLLMSCAGYAHPQSDKDHHPHSRHQSTHHRAGNDTPPNHRADRDIRDHNRENHDKYEWVEGSPHHPKRDGRYHHYRERPDDNDQVHHGPDKDERIQFQFRHRGELTPPTSPGANPVTPAPSFSNSPGSNGSSDVSSVQAFSDYTKIFEAFLGVASQLR